MVVGEEDHEFDLFLEGPILILEDGFFLHFFLSFDDVLLEGIKIVFFLEFCVAFEACCFPQGLFHLI